MMLEKKLFVYLFFSFIIATVVGTLSHEYSHYLMAKHLGYDQAAMHYNHVSHAPYCWPKQIEKQSAAIYMKYKSEIQHRQPFPQQEEYEKIGKVLTRERTIEKAAGFLQTIVIGTIGIVLLLLFRKSYKQTEQLAAWQWIVIFLSLFWLRELANFGVESILYFTNRLWSNAIDEIILSRAMGLNYWALSVLCGVIGAAVLALVTWFVPSRQRVTFLVAGLIGGFVGTLLWFQVLGPLLMP